MGAWANAQLNFKVYDLLLNEDSPSIGEAFFMAKIFRQLSGNDRKYVLFGDPAMKLKIPVPRRPTGVSLQSTLGGIIVSWNATTDCNGDPVAGYNLYRSTTPGENYTKINTALITGTEYTDATAEAGTTYYYVVRAVDDDGDESVQTLQLSVLAGIGTGSGSSAGSSGPCFISTAAGEIW